MRNFEALSVIEIDNTTGIVYLTAGDASVGGARLTLRREGGYVSISASFGPVEIALRPRFDDLVRQLSRLKPVSGLQTTRQVGTAEAYLGLGLQADGQLLVRPTLVADATGHLSFNLTLTDAIRQQLFEWLQIKAE